MKGRYLNNHKYAGDIPAEVLSLQMQELPNYNRIRSISSRATISGLRS